MRKFGECQRTDVGESGSDKNEEKGMKGVYGCYWGLLSLFMYGAGDHDACCFAKANVIRPLTCDSVQIDAVNGKRCSIKWKTICDRYVRLAVDFVVC